MGGWLSLFVSFLGFFSLPTMSLRFLVFLFVCIFTREIVRINYLSAAAF